MSQDPVLPPNEALLPPAPVGRRFVGRRKVRLGDVDRNGRLRLDSLTRYTQDVSDDDTTDANLPAEPGWVVRSTVVDEITPAMLAETITCETFCSALGKRWAERRLSISGDGGARYEVATLWVCIDASAGRPLPLTDRFLELYEEAADGRKVSAKLLNGKPASAPDGVVVEQWPLRVSDYDVYDHVNNAAYWAVVEEWGGGWTDPRRIRVEYGAGVRPAASVPIARWADDSRRSMVLWWLDVKPGDSPEEIGSDHHSVSESVLAPALDRPTLASAAISALPEGLYDPV